MGLGGGLHLRPVGRWLTSPRAPGLFSLATGLQLGRCLGCVFLAAVRQSISLGQRAVKGSVFSLTYLLGGGTSCVLAWCFTCLSQGSLCCSPSSSQGPGGRVGVSLWVSASPLSFHPPGWMLLSVCVHSVVVFGYVECAVKLIY